MKVRIARSLGLIILLMHVTLVPSAVGSQGIVSRKGQKLSLDFHDTRLKTVLEQLRSDAKISVDIPTRVLDRKVTVKVQDMDVDPALETLFKSASLRSFAIVHEPGSQGHIRVILVEEGKTKAQPVAKESSSLDDEPAAEASPRAAEALPRPSPGAADDPARGARWLGAQPSDDPNAPPPETIPALPQFAAEEASGPSGPQEMAVPESAVPPAMRNLPPEPGPAYPGAPEGSPFTPQMRAAMGFPPRPKH